MKIAEKRKFWRKGIIALFIIGIYYWSVKWTDMTITHLVTGGPHMWNFIVRLFPPDPTVLKKMVDPLIQTIQIALLGTTIPTILAVPLGFLAAKNTTVNKSVYYATRGLLNLFRGISELVWALLFVSMLGLGAFPGVMALAVHASGGLSKFYAESIEATDPCVIEAIRATGASRLKVVFYAILPQCIPLFLSYSLYYFEHNIRASTILGFVGAGGIGFMFVTTLKYLKSQEVLTSLIGIGLLLALIGSTN